ncbi:MULTISPECIES: hypothetical protein [Pseudomonas]|uniref:hypothetical protein n=1 Tax=Pseudomonas TaxID=286 RepID=UPI00111C0ED8|nr:MULTISPECIES: hypothetical protein [Pseudomonas]MCX4217577.1 hypothetical protein [Pseudomonas sp. MCal1]UIN53450.1 hypothetical protein LXN51_21115 [Pseudomonas kribbensis]
MPVGQSGESRLYVGHLSVLDRKQRNTGIGRSLFKSAIPAQAQKPSLIFLPVLLMALVERRLPNGQHFASHATLDPFLQGCQKKRRTVISVQRRNSGAGSVGLSAALSSD